MKQGTIIAIVLIVLGVAAFAYQGITYKTREKAVDLGAVQVTAEKTKHIPRKNVGLSCCYKYFRRN